MHLLRFARSMKSIGVITYLNYMTALASFRIYAIPILSKHGKKALPVTLQIFYLMFESRNRQRLKRSVKESIWADHSLGRKWLSAYIHAGWDVFPPVSLPTMRGEYSEDHPLLRASFRGMQSPLPLTNPAALSVIHQLDSIMVRQLDLIGMDGDENLAMGLYLAFRDCIGGFLDGPFALDQEARDLLNMEIDASDSLPEVPGSVEAMPPTPPVVTVELPLSDHTPPSSLDPGPRTNPDLSDSMPSLITPSDSSDDSSSVISPARSVVGALRAMEKSSATAATCGHCMGADHKFVGCPKRRVPVPSIERYSSSAPAVETQTLDPDPDHLLPPIETLPPTGFSAVTLPTGWGRTTRASTPAPPSFPTHRSIDISKLAPHSGVFPNPIYATADPRREGRRARAPSQAQERSRRGIYHAEDGEIL
jgi:hypothetical protein